MMNDGKSDIDSHILKKSILVKITIILYYNQVKFLPYLDFQHFFLGKMHRSWQSKSIMSRELKINIHF